MDHAENATLHEISSKSCPRYEVPSSELGDLPRTYNIPDYASYAKWMPVYEETGMANISEYFRQIGVKMGCNVFSGLHHVDPADLQKPDLLHNIYLGLFKHMMKWVEGFLKMHKWQQAFDDVWKVLPPYPRFGVRKKAYREVMR